MIINLPVSRLLVYKYFFVPHKFPYVKRLVACLILAITVQVVAQTAFAQLSIIVLDSGRKASLRGLCVVDDNTIWASGSNGTVARSVNGGKSFEWLTVKGYEARDFRDVEAFGVDTALIMAVDLPAVILKTYNGGKTWKEVFRDTTKGMFLDAMDFAGPWGAVVGDPINNNAFLAFTTDRGETWKGNWRYENGHVLQKKIPLQNGEAFFASSGTNIKILWDSIAHIPNTYMVTGGSHAGLVVGDEYGGLPLLQGSASQGANSIDVFDRKNLVVVGGDFAHDTVTYRNCLVFQADKGGYYTPNVPPHGYRSCVKYLAKYQLITCGTSGVDVSNDGGLNWALVSRQSFHVCQKAKKGNAVFLAGANGKIAAYR